MSDPQSTPSGGQDTGMSTSHPPPGPSRTRSQPLVAQQASTTSTAPPTSPPIPAPSSNGRRNRAHTVSVSFKPQSSPRRSPSVSTGQSSGLATALTSEYGMAPLNEDAEDNRSTGSRRRSSNADKRQRSGSVNRRSIVDSLRQSAVENEDRPGTPVSFELAGENEELHDEVVGVLDVIDPQVSTVNHLQNVSNTLIFPHFPALWSRRPEVILPEQHEESQPLTSEDDPLGSLSRRQPRRHRASTVSRLFPPSLDSSSGFQPIPELPSPGDGPQPGLSPEYPDTGTVPPTTAPTSTAPLVRSSSDVPGFTSEVDRQMRQIDEEIEKDHHLDAHVKHVLSQSKRAKLKRAGKGLWAFVKTPMGAITAIYGFLVAFWGAAIVLFLLGWIPTSSKNQQDIWVEITSQVENGLFTVTGIGLIPWRVIDTIRMAKIWHLRVETHKRRKAQGLEPIADPNDLPDPKEAKDYVSVLTEKEQEELAYQQMRFSKSQTWYRPHATSTHTAFPIKWALWNTLLMDGNSFFQCILCGTMWGLNRHQRPAWSTGILIPASFLCGITAGILIWQGSARTKKTISVQDKLREALALPIAVSGLQRTGDGTVILANTNSATLPSTESDEGTSPNKTGTGAEKPSGQESSAQKVKRRWFARKYKAQDEEKGMSMTDKTEKSKLPVSAPGVPPTTTTTATTAPSPLRAGESGLARRATVTFGHMYRPEHDLHDELGHDHDDSARVGGTRARGVTVGSPRISQDALGATAAVSPDVKEETKADSGTGTETKDDKEDSRTGDRTA